MTESQNAIQNILAVFCTDNNAILEKYENNGSSFSCTVSRGDYTCEIPIESTTIDPKKLYNRLYNRIVVRKNVNEEQD